MLYDVGALSASHANAASMAIITTFLVSVTILLIIAILHLTLESRHNILDKLNGLWSLKEAGV